jgi:hypothetical protein
MQPHSYNTDTERLDSQRVKSVTTMGWTNYKKPGYSWDKISNLILPDGTVTKQNLNVQLPGSSQGWTDILFDSQFSIIRSSIDGRSENNEPALELSVCVETQHNVTGTIDPNNPNVMLYSDAWDGADLRMGTFSGTRPRLNKIVAIKQMPPGDSENVEYSFLMRSNTAKAMVGGVRPWYGNVGDYFNLVGQEAFIARGDSQIRGCFLGRPKCWWYTTDEDGEEIQEIRDIELNCVILSDGETVRATKKIPRDYIQQAISDGSYLFTDNDFVTDWPGPGRDFWTNRKISEGGHWGNAVSSTQRYIDMMEEDAHGTGGASNAAGNVGYAKKAPFFQSTSSTSLINGISKYNYKQIAIKGYYFDTSALSGEVDTSATSTVEIPIKSEGSATSNSAQINIFSSKDLAEEWEIGDPVSMHRDYWSGNTDHKLKYIYSSIYGQPALSTAKSSFYMSSTDVRQSYNTFTLNSAGQSVINKDGFTKILMTFSNWDDRVAGGSDPGLGSTQSRYLICYHPDYIGSDSNIENDGAKLTTTFKQVTNPGAFWLMG